LQTCPKKKAQRQIFQVKIKTGHWTGFFRGEISDRKAKKGLGKETGPLTDFETEQGAEVRSCPA
jgi:hypothetical protein